MKSCYVMLVILTCELLFFICEIKLNLRPVFKKHPCTEAINAILPGFYKEYGPVASINYFFFLFTAAPRAYGSSQARGWIRAVAASLRHSHSNTRSELHLWPMPWLVAMPDLLLTRWGQGLNLHPQGGNVGFLTCWVTMGTLFLFFWVFFFFTKFWFKFFFFWSDKSYDLLFQSYCEIL